MVRMPEFFVDQYPWQPVEAWRPTTKCELSSDDEHVRLEFSVSDAYVLGRYQSSEDPVWEDSCVEFFFDPSNGLEAGYFNLEISVAGGFLFHYQLARGVAKRVLTGIEVQVTPGKLIESEQEQPLEWRASATIPFSVLRAVKSCNRHIWRGNFYKCAESNSHPHWGSWAPIDTPPSDFHRPEFFREINLG